MLEAGLAMAARALASNLAALETLVAQVHFTCCFMVGLFLSALRLPECLETS